MVAGWRCPECGRRFAQRTREHSCQITSIEDHLARTSPEVRSAFAALLEVLSSIGPHEVIALKTMLVFRVASNFAGATLTRSRIDLGFFLSQQVRHPRVRRIERLSPTKLAHHVHLEAASEIDAELRAWLREAYMIGAAARARSIAP